MEDNELIYQYQIEFQEPALIYLFNQYATLIEKITFLTFKKFIAVPIEIQDLNTIKYFSFLKSVSLYQEYANKSFVNFMQQRLKWDLLQYLRKYVSKNHAVMNFATSYDKIHDWFQIDNESIKPYFLSEPQWLNYGVAFLTKLENEVLLLKGQDYSNEEISLRLNISYKAVDNAFQRAKTKLQKLKTENKTGE